METLKAHNEITEPDERNSFFVDENLRPLTLERIHNEVSKITLNISVPDEIRNHFAQALNLAVYSWFHYQFHVTADFMCMVSVEYALKVKSKKKSSFKQLIALAVNEGWITDDGFGVARRRKSSERSYVQTLVEVLPALRNNYAHGSTTLHNDSLGSLGIAADFINQLFPAEPANLSLYATAQTDHPDLKP